MKGHLRERSPGRWAIVLDSRDPDTGKRRRKWHSFRGTKREAQVECSRLVTEMTKGAYLEPSKLTLSQFVDQWLEHVEPRVAPRTFERYREIARKNLVPLLGRISAGALSISLAGSFQLRRARNRRRKAFDKRKRRAAGRERWPFRP
jgi:hypothetical protein